MLCRDVNDLLEGYAAGALTGAERVTVDAHLDAGCDDCRRTLAELTLGAVALGVGEEPIPPPPSLKAGLMSRIDAHSRDALPIDSPPPDEPTASLPQPAPPTRRRGAGWRSYVGVAIAASLVGVLATRLPSGAGPDPQPLAVAQANAELDAYRRRIAETDHVLGLSRTRVVNLAADPRGDGLRPHLIYDEVSRQLHVLVPSGQLAGKGKSGWAWVVNRNGEAAAKCRLAPIGDAFSGAAIDLPTNLAEGARLVLTAEENDSPNAPSESVLGDVGLDLPGTPPTQQGLPARP